MFLSIKGPTFLQTFDANVNHNFSDATDGATTFAQKTFKSSAI